MGLKSGDVERCDRDYNTTSKIQPAEYVILGLLYLQLLRLEILPRSWIPTWLSFPILPDVNRSVDCNLEFDVTATHNATRLRLLIVWSYDCRWSDFVWPAFGFWFLDR